MSYKLTKPHSIRFEQQHIEFMKENIISPSELVRYLINNYQPYKEWVAKHGR